MLYKKIYKSIVGKILIIFVEENLLGLYLESQKEFDEKLKDEEIKLINLKSLDDFDEEKFKILKLTEDWLDKYFVGKDPGFLPPIKVSGSEFRKDVWEVLLKIPYGETMTYKEVGEELLKSGKYERVSNQAVGGAVGHNPISLIIPCHRVIGSDGSLRGYAGGLDVKRKLLELEGEEKSKKRF
ncbi:MAG: methylated-DNA--[protein]-cysteine S-methyltransferase [Peptoniphilus harei]|uniref:methylated-DNA--[protein]-cysteine S-methyltransferase n=1 Tax=Peptoniphilus harei TaxID=54005 RepID=UPI0028FFF6FD|nr:methylated-DNA--[protein]-cysteine S-methyltransferase [Peptoniphilus harei]MDU3087276.1 methylated-DNA--[protein]-cysteine S-methyltransferase [Peptoniphilus harei]